MTQTLPACPLWLYRWLPFLRWWPMVGRDTLKVDGLAGFTGALIVLPQGVAFATIAGLPPQYGLYAAMVPTVVAALFGSSWHLVSGPTTAISIAVFAAVSPYAEPGTPQFISLVLTLTFLTGLLQFAMGLARLGVLVNFISHTVVIGFTAGAAVLIAASQVKNFFGLDIPRGAAINEIVGTLLLNFDKVNPYVTGVAVVTLVTGFAFRKFLPKLPYMIAAMLVGSLVAVVVNSARGGAEVTGIRTIGALPAALPPFSLPDFSFAALHQMAFPAAIVTLLALTEAVSISRSIAVKSEQRIDGDQEFIGQGLSNLFGSFFSGYASSGSFNRSGVNFEGGARTPLAAVFASLFLLLVVLLVAPLAAYLPTAAMAAVLFLVAIGLVDLHHIKGISEVSREERWVLWVTLIGTLINLEKGIFFGIMLSLVLYLWRTSRPAVVPVVPDPAPDSYHYVPVNGQPECPQLKMVRIYGSVFFGAVDHVQGVLLQIDEYRPQQKRVLIAANGMNFIDVAGAEMFAAEARRRRKLGGALYFYRLQDEVREFMEKGHYLDDVGVENLFPTKSRPIATIYPKLDSDICRSCTARIFPECHRALPDGTPREDGPAL